MTIIFFGLSLGSNTFAAAKSSDEGLAKFAGAYSGTITFPTTLFGMGVNYTGQGLLIVTASGKKATFQFICGAGGYQVIPTSVSILSKVNSNGKFSTTGQLNGDQFTSVVGKAKLRGKKLTAAPIVLSIPGSPSTLTWGVNYKVSGKTITATGPATFHDTFNTSSGVFTFKGKRVSL